MVLPVTSGVRLAAVGWARSYVRDPGETVNQAGIRRLLQVCPYPARSGTTFLESLVGIIKGIIDDLAHAGVCIAVCITV